MNDPKDLAKAYSRATQELRKHHDEEFQILLQEQYDAMGMTVRTRLTGERKRQRDLEKLRAALADLESGE